MSVDKIYEIDRQSFIQKCKIMARWQKLYGLNFGCRSADELTFCDLLDVVKDQNGEEVYAELYKLVRNGVNAAQKAFLYGDYSGISFVDEADGDFDGLLGNFSCVLNGKKLGLIVMEICKNNQPSKGCYLYSPVPMPRIEYVFETSQSRTEAILVQNGAVLIVRGVVSVREVLRQKKIKAMMNADWENNV